MYTPVQIVWLSDFTKVNAAYCAIMVIVCINYITEAFKVLRVRLDSPQIFKGENLRGILFNQEVAGLWYELFKVSDNYRQIIHYSEMLPWTNIAILDLRGNFKFFGRILLNTPV